LNHDGAEGGAYQFDTVSFENAALGQLDGEVKRGLAADSGKQSVGALGGNDGFKVVGGERLDVGAVGELGIGHDGGRIGVDQDDLVALTLERLAGLGAGIVEFAGLTDDNGPRADDKYLLDVSALGHLGLTQSGYACQP
jgi:hypothetical protein